MTSLDQAFIRAFSKEDQAHTQAADLQDELNNELYVEATDPVKSPVESPSIRQSISIVEKRLPSEETIDRNYAAFIVDANVHSLAKPPSAVDGTVKNPVQPPQTNPSGESNSDSAKQEASRIAPFTSNQASSGEPEATQKQASIESDIRIETANPQPSFKPVWEVDEFRIPSPCLQIQTGLQEQLYSVRSLLRDVFHDQQKLINVHSCKPGEGRTTLAIGLAYFMAQHDHKVLIIDANHDQPTLAETLGLSVEFGWERFISGEEALEECCIRSLNDRFSILPMMTNDWSIGELGFGETLRTMIESLIHAFDLILLDTSAGRPMWSSEMEDVTAAHFIIRDVRQTADAALLQMKRHLTQHSNRIVETIENFSVADHINLKMTA
ncbi:MAG: CpsD/CapB family tyrosine-protein kinase [Planctomycetaceae bacterium]|nr:CpsD/CapB family tyrosine-protein kinase [Planctomycetaceae bacterium]